MNAPAFLCVEVNQPSTQRNTGEIVILFATWERFLAFHPFLQMNVSQR